jgi:hypothetical protein
MRYLLASILLLAGFPVSAQSLRPAMEARSHVTVLVDLSGTWLSKDAKARNKRELEAVATTIVTMAPTLKPPVEIQYIEIGDGSLAREPLCSARYAPSIFPSMASDSEFADLSKLKEFFGEDCMRLILARRPQPYTDITGALNSLGRISANRNSTFNAAIVLSDFKEERRRNQIGDIGSLRGMHALLLYRVLEEDRYDQTKLDARLNQWRLKLHRAGASVAAAEDVALDPAELTRLLTQ